MNKRKQIRGIASSSHVAVAILFVALCSPSKSLASLIGDEVFVLVELHPFGLATAATASATVHESWEFRFSLTNGIFGGDGLFEMDISSDAIEIQLLSGSFPFFPVIFTFSDLDWVGHPNAKLSNVVLESALPDDSSPPEITFTDDTVEFTTYWEDVGVQRFRLFTSNELQSVAVPALPIPLLFTGLLGMVLIGWRQ